MRRRAWAAGVAVLCVALIGATPPPTAPGVATAAADRAAVVQDEAYWVSTAQLTCTGDGAGAIAEARIAGPGRVSVHPYEANIGARALVAAGGRYLPMVAAYVRWYLGHLNRPDRHGVTGTVYDHDVDPVTCASTFQRDPVTGDVPTYDSTDAYAGTFLTLVADWARTDQAAVDVLGTPQARADLEAVAGAVLATLRPSGLTAATPVFDAEYLLDNIEAQQGLDDYASLLRGALDDPDRAGRWADAAAGIRTAIEDVLWRGSSTPGLYGVAADALAPSADRWFPDALAQLWPVMYGLGPADRRADAWTAFSARWPGWTTSTPSYGATSPEHDPNASVAYAAARAGDTTALDAYLVSSQRNWADAGRPPPWTVDDAGFRALAARAG